MERKTGLRHEGVFVGGIRWVPQRTQLAADEWFGQVEGVAAQQAVIWTFQVRIVVLGSV